MTKVNKPEYPSLEGKKNIYVCRECKGHIVTVDLVEGVTPFAIPCQAKVGCEGMMQSSMYRVFDQEIGETHEWYRPSVLEVLTPGQQQHVNQGGLLLRRKE